MVLNGVDSINQVPDGMEFSFSFNFEPKYLLFDKEIDLGKVWCFLSLAKLETKADGTRTLKTVPASHNYFVSEKYFGPIDFEATQKNGMKEIVRKL